MRADAKAAVGCRGSEEGNDLAVIGDLI